MSLPIYLYNFLDDLSSGSLAAAEVVTNVTAVVAGANAVVTTAVAIAATTSTVVSVATPVPSALVDGKLVLIF